MFISAASFASASATTPMILTLSRDAFQHTEHVLLSANSAYTVDNQTRCLKVMPSKAREEVVCDLQLQPAVDPSDRVAADYVCCIRKKPPLLI
jgi:hypothetical protein